MPTLSTKANRGWLAGRVSVLKSLEEAGFTDVRISDSDRQAFVDASANDGIRCGYSNRIHHNPDSLVRRFGHAHDGCRGTGETAMKMFMAALATETNSFSPKPTGEESFKELLFTKQASYGKLLAWGAPLNVWRKRPDTANLLVSKHN